MTSPPNSGQDTRPGPEPAAITVQTVSLSFDELRVLEDVSLSVSPGEFVGFVGPNGAGKTTLLRAISGALEPTTGTIEIGGTDVHDVSSRESSRLVAAVPQDTSLSFSFPVRDVVEMGRHPHRSRFSPPTADDRLAVEDALERTRTAELADRPIDEISGGQRQRVVLARAVAQETPVLLLDEPTASLDINHQIETLELVRELVDDGRTVVAAIHDLDLAARYCDRLVMLAGGTLHADGSPSDVLTSETLAAAFHANATVTPNPITGTPTVTALPDRQATDVDAGSGRTDGGDGSTTPTVHVVGTGTTAAGVLARLDVDDLSVSIGPVPADGITAEAARNLGVESLEVDPFSPPPPAVRSRLEERVSAADVTVAADVVIGSDAGRRHVLETIEDADPLVVVHRRAADDRIVGDERSDAWRRRYETCRERGREATVESTLEAVRAALERRQESDGLDRRVDPDSEAGE
ncbi:heme ABC transporter ATP-binding protein [Natrialba swarupiae]|uniref:Cobalamin import ATP-binding protein BtuD n=1 Tax=Natrialba swarupiae TaxID=2448032 RepID=A0A5D5AJA6_9EURY|nr:heme ABC transporter ATP-binding protein [Natrialba swarupiae]TYT60907.1 heme ABC transporter ATP-binding protein [Natrialba swarupiae]